MTLLLPEGRQPEGVLYLLHGFSDGHDAALRNSSLARFCADLPLAVVMPDAQNSFYMDTAYGQAYWSHISQEVPAMLKKWFRLELPREKTFVGGFSMGGYGAAKLALQYPGRYAEAFLFSPVTDIVSVTRQGFDCAHFPDAPSPDMLHMGEIMGSRGPGGTDADLYHLLRQANAEELPAFRLYSGTEDFLYQDIQTFYRSLQEKNVEADMRISGGRHLWVTWEHFLEEMAAVIAARLS